MAEPRGPWLYPYREDPQQLRLGQPVLRPFVPVSIVANGESTPELEGLIDTGADAVLASDLLAEGLGVDLRDNEGEARHRVGGRDVMARYKDVTLRLHDPDPASDGVCEWSASVGFVDGWHSFRFVLLGSVGFLDQFTVTAGRFAQAESSPRTWCKSTPRSSVDLSAAQAAWSSRTSASSSSWRWPRSPRIGAIEPALR